MSAFKNHLELFIPLSEQEFDQILQYFSYRELKKSEYLIQNDQLVDHTYWIKKGLLISSFTDSNGKEHIIQFAIENCWITDQDAYYNRTRATFNIVCLEDSEILCLSYSNREKLCADVPKMETFFRRKANDSFVKQQRRLLTYMTSEVKERYDLLLKEYPGLAQRVPKKILAAYLGVTRETLSRFRY
ncbi:MAG: Crp/Fnr family transcriptional regulator [Chryseolinea sp.]